LNREQLTLSLGEHRVSPSRLRDSGRDWMIRVATWPSSFLELLMRYIPSGWFGRTSPVSCRLSEDGLLAPSSGAWRNSGMGSPTGFWTLSTLAWPNDAAVCMLSAVLETGEVPLRYYLSAKACRGIIRRAEKRGKKLPEQLQAALRQVADSELTSSVPEDYR